ncbi:MAG TPA: TolC family protein [Puia sp.]|jgi:outer membrane protein TolC|nr:TolC family protein [Puia sp.]
MNKKLRNWGSRLSLAAALFLLTIHLRAQQPAGTPPPAPAQPSVHDLSVRQAIDYASKNSVIVRNALLDYQIQEQSNRATTSQALPQITGGAGFTQYIQVPVTPVPGGLFPGTVPGKVYPFPFGVTYNSSANITLKQVLFDGQVFVGLQARQASLDFYRKKEEVTEQMVRVNIYKVYYQLLIAKSQMDQIDANIANQQAQLRSNTEMFKNGFAEQLDVDKATVQLANLETEKLGLQFNIDNGYLGLKVLIGMPVRDSIQLTDSLTYDQIRDAALTDDYKYTDRRDFQLMMISQTLGEYNIKRYQKEYIPTLNFSATYQQSQYSEKLDLTAHNSWYPASYYSLNLNIPIFDGFYKDANIRQARLQLRQTENNIDSLKNRIDNDVRQSQLQFSSALATLDYQKKNMELAEKVYQQTRKKFEQGLGSNTEITTAFSDERTAQYNYFNALYSAILAKVDYLNAIGKL